MIRYSRFLFIAALTVMSSCSVNKATINKDLKKYFDSAHVDGCFALLDNATGKITVYNMKLDTQRVLPASTFKIVNSLIVLETGKITDEKMVIKWDGVKRWNEDWNKDLTM
jgi:beta-lactamase class D